MSEIYSGRNTQSAVEMFRPIVKRGYNQFISDTLRSTLKNAMNQSDAPLQASENATVATPQPAASPVQADELSQDELKAFAIVKSILHDLCDLNRLFTRSAKNYVSVNLDDNRNKRICRFWFKGKKLYITIPDEDRQPVRYDISGLNDIYNHAELLKESCNRHLTRGEFAEIDEIDAEED